MKFCVTFLAVLGLASCTGSEKTEDRVLVLKVDGMQRGHGGKT